MNLITTVQTFLSKQVTNGTLPGAQFALVSENGFESGCIGKRQIIPESKPVLRDTMYDLASLSKVIVTATLVLQCMEKDILNLTTPVFTILPDFPYSDITIGMLLTHSSGMIGDDKRYKSCADKKSLYRFYLSLPLAYVPGTDLQYSDFGFMTLGLVLEKITGLSLDVLAKTYIFDPLGMKHTMYCPKKNGYGEQCAATEWQPDRGMIIGEVHDGKGYRMGGVSGHAGVFSTADDLAVFVMMLLENGNWQGKQILSANSIKLLKNYRTKGMRQCRTLGWIAEDKRASMGSHYSTQCLYHTGFTGGSIYVDFVRHMGIVLLTNAIHPSREKSHMKELRPQFHDVILHAFDEKKQSI